MGWNKTMLKELPNPFRPGSGLYPPFFAGRGREIEAFNKKKESTKTNFPMHLAILGDWAIGKTSLLKRMEKEASESFYYNYVASIESMEHFFRTFTRGLSLKVRLMRGESLLRKIQKRIGLESLKLSFFGLNAEMKFKSSGDAQLILIEYIYNLWEEIKKDSDLMIVTVDDLDLVREHDGILFVLRNTCMELAELGVKIMLVVSGSIRLFEKMREIHGPLVRFFEPLIIENLSQEEAISAVTNPLDELQVNYDRSVINKLVDLSGGHPYYLQEICYHVFEEAQQTIDEDAHELGFEKAFSDISLLVLQDKASKISEAESKVVRSMKAKRYYSISQLSENCNIKKSSLNTYLRRLKQKGILFQDKVGEHKGQYIQRDPLLKIYLDTL